MIDALPAHIAILDQDGLILETNRAWQSFTRKHPVLCGFSTEGDNYIQACSTACGDNMDRARELSLGLRRILSGEQDQFRLEYSFDPPARQRWFIIRIARLPDISPLRLIVSHEEITRLKQAEDELKQAEQALIMKKRQLVEKNRELTALLETRDIDRHAFEKRILLNARELIFPCVEKLKSALSRTHEQTLIHQVQDRMNALLSPFMTHPEHAGILLTPQEIQVAELVRDGRSSQEISEILAISESTVHFHRKNLRKKLGLAGKKENLRSRLLAMSI